MNYRELYENKIHGTGELPFEFYSLNPESVSYFMPFHWHYEYEIIRVLKGSFSLSLDGESHILSEGDCAFYGSGVIHGGTPHDAEYECVVLDLESIVRKSPLPEKTILRFIEDFSGKSEVFESFTRCADKIRWLFNSLHDMKPGNEWAVFGCIFELIGNLVSQLPDFALEQKPDNQIKRLRDVLRYIRDNYGEQITLSDLASVAGMSPRYFCRAFASITDKTPIQYLNFYRIEAAGERLRRSSDSITDIAMSCGFNDMSYFSKMFLRQKNATPSDYRKLHKSKA